MTEYENQLMRILGSVEAKVDTLLEAHAYSRDQHDRLKERVVSLENDKTVAMKVFAIIGAAAGVIGGLVAKVLHQS